MPERRKQTRKSLMSYSQVFDLNGGILLGYLADLTQQGAMVISQRVMDVDREIDLQFEVPELEGIPLRRLSLPACIVWCKPDISPSFQNIGFEFRETTPEQVKVIEAIIETYEFRHEAPVYPFRPATKR